MLKFLVASVGLAAMAVGAAPKAEAAGIPIVWGTQHNFDKLSTITMPQELAGELPPGAELTRHSETFAIFWVLGLWVTDKGYAIHAPDSDEYIELSDDDLKMLQEMKAVPDPLASNGIAPGTYAMGFAGWGAALVLVLIGVAAQSRKKVTPPPADAPPSA